MFGLYNYNLIKINKINFDFTLTANLMLCYIHNKNLVVTIEHFIIITQCPYLEMLGLKGGCVEVVLGFPVFQRRKCLHISV